MSPPVDASTEPVPADPPGSPLRARLLLASVAVAGLALSLLGGWFAQGVEERRIEAGFQKRSAVQLRLARERLRLHAELVRGLRTHFENSNEVDPAEFRRYVALLRERLPALRVLQWAPRVPAGSLPAFEAAAAASLGRPYQVWEREQPGRRESAAIPARDREEYWPIRYVEPRAGHEAALGFDLFESTFTRALLERARAERRAQLSPQVSLIRAEGRDRGIGVILIEPVFREETGAAPADGFLGFLQAIFAVERLLADVHAEEPEEAVDLAYFDDAAQFEHLRLLYARAGTGGPRGSGEDAARWAAGLAAAPGAQVETIVFGERTWRVVVALNPVWAARQRTPVPWIVLVTALLFSAAAVLLVHGLQSRAARTEALVAHRTAELAESRRRLASVLADMPGAAYRCAPEPPYQALFLSEGIEALTGYPPADFTERGRQWGELIHPADAGRCAARIADAVARGEPFELEYRIRHRDGTERHIWERGHADRDASGRATALEGLMVDATARAQAEAREREFDRKLLETQKLESLGVLAGGIAHDFNNLLASMLGNASLVRLELPPGDPSQARLAQVETAARRAADLCAQLLAYAGRGTVPTSRVDLSALVRECVALLEVSHGKGTRLDLQLPASLPAVVADSTQVRQVVMNLVINAAEAIGDRTGVITVSTFAATATPEELRGGVGAPELPGGLYAGLEVRDTGGGIPAAVLARIFEPFFTTKFSGRGLGLSAVLGIVRSHRGALFVASEPGKGTAFRLLLPAAAPGDDAAGPALAGPGAAADAGGDAEGGVLVVDDEPAVRDLAALALRQAGFEVFVAADGFEALELWRRHPEMIDAVLLDLTMPRLSGEETLRRLREAGATLPVILMSGYSAQESMRRAADHGAVAFLPKPFELRELIGLVARHVR